jgi:hypothetical protein
MRKEDHVLCMKAFDIIEGVIKVNVTGFAGSGYKGESIPFKAKIVEVTDYEYTVISEVTGNEYVLYHQNVEEYGNDDFKIIHKILLLYFIVKEGSETPLDTTVYEICNQIIF